MSMPTLAKVNQHPSWYLYHFERARPLSGHIKPKKMLDLISETLIRDVV